MLHFLSLDHIEALDKRIEDNSEVIPFYILTLLFL